MRFALTLPLLLPALAIAAPRPAEDNLPRRIAEQRRAQIRSVDYHLTLEFGAGKEDYRGRVVIDAELNDTTKPLSVDWLGKAPLVVVVNGAPFNKFKAQTGSLEFPASVLKRKTEITIAFENAFSKEGEGIQHVTDPEDKAEYVYSDFEPYEAHQLFPCFDQPDLKAHFDLAVTAPVSWRVIGNEPIVADDVKPGQATSTRNFKRTPLLSPYLFFVGAGDFQEWTDKNGKTPLVIYARRSLTKYVDAENLFATMKKGLNFYADYFGYEYPFDKFGLVFAPEFGWGGMENPGAIVVNERNLFRGPVPGTRREGRDDLILHEMAHHWFGDLVTMKWWNDLWLNESFATYLASVAHDRAFGSKNVWQDFASSKSWGYWQDQLVTTHPIETKVPDTRTARGNFDGITYAKGAAALQQLHFYVGENAFRDGIRAYFRDHAFGNAERRNFVGAIAKAAGLDLGKWTHAWLRTAGLNRVHVDLECTSDGTPSLDGFRVVQTRSSSGTLSPHRTRVGFFVRRGSELALVDSVDVSFEGASTKDEPRNAVACPDFTFPNLDDKDYALYSLNEESLANVELVLAGAIADPLLRMQTWNMLSQMVRDGQLAPLRYHALAVGGLRKEDDEGVLSILLGRYSPLKDLYTDYLSPTDRGELAPAFEQVVLDRLAAAEKGSTKQMLFFDFFTRLVQTPANLEKIAGWLEKNDPPAGITLDQERRWTALITLARNGFARAPALVDAEEKKDPSDLGKRSAYAARVALPTEEAKATFWKALDHVEQIPPSTLRAAVAEFHQPNYLDLSKGYVKPYFDRLRTLDWKKSDSLVKVYFGGLFPGNLCSKEVLDQSRAALRGAKNLTDLARRSWLEANDELARCVRVGRR